MFKVMPRLVRLVAGLWSRRTGSISG